MKNLSFIIISIILLSACQNESFEMSERTESHFFLENRNAIMPIIVRGNTLSNSFCLVLHGGPGDSAIQSFHATNTFKQVEEEFAMVYFDQRGSGLSQGNIDAKALEIEYFVEDIDKIIELLRHQYNEDISIFILGHSWGATLALEYLLNGQYKTEVAGCIQSNGSHSIPLASTKGQEMILEYAKTQIELDNSVATWTEIKNIVEPLDPTQFFERIQIVEQGYKTLKPLLIDDIVNKVTAKMENQLVNISNTFITSHNTLLNNNIPFYEKLMVYDITEDLIDIETPIGFYWGRHDLAIASSIAKDIFDGVGSENKELVYFERSHHAPMMHENDLYQEKMIEFIAKYE